MKDLGGVGGHGLTFLAVLFRNHFEDTGQLCKGTLPRVHQRVATRDGRDISNPRTIRLPIENRFVVFEFHTTTAIIQRSEGVPPKPYWRFVFRETRETFDSRSPLLKTKS